MYIHNVVNVFIDDDIMYMQLVSDIIVHIIIVYRKDEKFWG